LPFKKNTDLRGLVSETDQIRVHLPDPYHPRSLLLGEHRFCGFNGLARIAFYNGFNPLSLLLGEHRFCGFNGLARIAFYNGFNPLSTIKIVHRPSSIVNKKGPAFAEPFSFQ